MRRRFCTSVRSTAASKSDASTNAKSLTDRAPRSRKIRKAPTGTSRSTKNFSSSFALASSRAAASSVDSSKRSRIVYRRRAFEYELTASSRRASNQVPFASGVPRWSRRGGPGAVLACATCSSGKDRSGRGISPLARTQARIRIRSSLSSGVLGQICVGRAADSRRPRALHREVGRYTSVWADATALRPCSAASRMATCSPSKNATRSRSDFFAGPLRFNVPCPILSRHQRLVLRGPAYPLAPGTRRLPDRTLSGAAVAAAASATACSASVASSNGVQGVPTRRAQARASFFSTPRWPREGSAPSAPPPRFSAKSWSQRRRASAVGRQRSSATPRRTPPPRSRRKLGTAAQPRSPSGASSDTASSRCVGDPAHRVALRLTTAVRRRDRGRPRVEGVHVSSGESAKIGRGARPLPFSAAAEK